MKIVGGLLVVLAGILSVILMFVGVFINIVDDRLGTIDFDVDSLEELLEDLPDAVIEYLPEDILEMEGQNIEEQLATVKDYIALGQRYIKLGWLGVILSFGIIIFGIASIPAKSKIPSIVVIVLSLITAILGGVLLTGVMVLALLGGLLVLFGVMRDQKNKEQTA